MLNLTIVMLDRVTPFARAAALFLAFAALVISGKPLPARAQEPQVTPTPQIIQQAVILSPSTGEALQGVVTIRGSSGLSGFRSAEIAFAYQSDPTRTWFLIYQSDQPVIDAPLAAWDTTTITDGNYRLRLQVFLADGQVLESVVDGLRVRNYSPVETTVPVQAAESPSTGVQPTITPTTAPLPDFQPAAQSAQRSTSMAANPVQITRADLGKSALRGVLVVFGGLLLAGIYLGLRALLRR